MLQAEKVPAIAGERRKPGQESGGPVCDYPPEESGKEYRTGNGAGNPAGRIPTGSQKGTRAKGRASYQGKPSGEYREALRVCGGLFSI